MKKRYRVFKLPEGYYYLKQPTSFIEVSELYSRYNASEITREIYIRLMAEHFIIQIDKL